MRKLNREQCLKLHEATKALPTEFAAVPLQLGMQRDPWRVALASMLLCRAKRVQAERVLRILLTRWPTPADLMRAEIKAVQEAVRPCGLHRARARILQRFCAVWLGDHWHAMQGMPGVGMYVADAIGLFCFDDTDLESSDHVLREYADRALAQRADTTQLTPDTYQEA